MRSLAFLVFLFLIVPGSGRLVFDGLPLSTRAEFAALVLFVTAFLSQEIRRTLSGMLQKTRWSVALRPLLLMLCLVKLFSFAWSPLGDGFAACYRSIYSPLSDPAACEKSYESPFLPGGNPTLSQISRIDPIVDFGHGKYDWSLPFMNDTPRLAKLWIERFPFTARYVAEVSSSVPETVYLPIRSIGELQVRLNDRLVSDTIDYDREFLTVVPLSPGTSKLEVSFRYSDDDAVSPPETAPAPRGPYAQLKIGKPLSIADLTSVSKVVVRGNVLPGMGPTTLGTVSLRDGRGSTIGKPVVIDWTSDPPPRRYDFEIEVDASALAHSPISVTNALGGRTTELATVSTNADNPFQLVLTERSDSGIRSFASFTAESGALPALEPTSLSESNLIVTTLLALLDLMTWILVIGLVVLVIIVVRGALIQAFGLAAIAWVLVEPIDDLLPAIIGGGRELVLPYAVIALLVVLFRRSTLRFPIACLLPVSAVLATQKVLEHLYFDHPDHGDGWWGKLIYYWRDSDWFVARGKARAIFVDGSLAAGDAVYYTQTASRYVVYITNLLLGENDALIGLISVTLGFTVVFFLVSRFAERTHGRSGVALAAFVGFVCLMLIGDQITVAFGFVMSSEFPTWVLIMAITAFVLNTTPEKRVWTVTSIVVAIAFLTLFRANAALVSVALLPLITLRLKHEDATGRVRQLLWAAVTFAILMTISLIKNLHYGSSFTPLTAVASINYAFSWGELFGQSGFSHSIDLLWSQLRALMYWRVPHDPNFAIFFWGAQLIFVLALIARARRKSLRVSTTLIALLPLSYIVPMLKFLYESYYPRHLVTASLLCLCSGLLLWPIAEKDPSATT